MAEEIEFSEEAGDPSIEERAESGGEDSYVDIQPSLLEQSILDLVENNSDNRKNSKKGSSKQHPHMVLFDYFK